MPCAPFPGIQPIVLVGGKSRRFGRDKLLEPVDGGFLVDRPISALRAVFGPIVAVVGDCDPKVRARADRSIEDRYPGVGPAGGILSALETAGSDIFVLAGDLPRITAAPITELLTRAAAAPAARAILARTTRLEPCIGLYRPTSIDLLRSRLREGRLSLFDLIPAEHLVEVQIAEDQAININAPDQVIPRPLG